MPGGLRYTVADGEAVVSFRTFFELLATDPDFGRWYTRVLAEIPLEAYFWEFPAISSDRFDDPVEFVAIEGGALTGLRADATPFRQQFAAAPGATVVTFPNLGGDALLVVPTHVGADDAYPHLAAFVRRGPPEQVESFWPAVATAVQRTLDTAPRWLSTAGLGVAWLHVRLDTRPKYYSYAPYKAPVGQAIARP